MIEELERLARAATPSDGWFVLKLSNGSDVRARHVTGASTWIAECRTDAEAQYIAACSPDRVLRLLEVVKQAKLSIAYHEGLAAICRTELSRHDAALRAALAGLEEGK
jgi:hypothetical protein